MNEETQTDVQERLRAHGLDARLDHVAVAARRIRDLLPLYHQMLSARFINGGDNVRVGYRALQLEYSDGSKIELMEPLEGSTFFDRFFARGGGLHHVTFKVDDIHAAVEAARDLGFEPTGLYIDDPDWQEVFLHPKQANGVLVQLAQPAPGYPPPPGNLTLEHVLAGQGWTGNGIPSP